MIQKKNNNHRNEQAHVKKYYVHFKYHIIRATQVTLPLLGISVYIVFCKSLCMVVFLSYGCCYATHSALLDA